jgi:multicomponent Na+:H+ antiporter subunit G
MGELLVLLGAVLVLLASLGVVRFRDPLARMHALAKGSTLGVLLIFAGAAVSLGNVNDVTSVVLAGILHVITSPPTSNMLSRAIYLATGLAHDTEAIDEGAEPLGLHAWHPPEGAHPEE